jgi:hypothetical protein
MDTGSGSRLPRTGSSSHRGRGPIVSELFMPQSALWDLEQRDPDGRDGRSQILEPEIVTAQSICVLPRLLDRCERFDGNRVR